jgi:hypothetical protein
MGKTRINGFIITGCVVNIAGCLYFLFNDNIPKTIGLIAVVFVLVSIVGAILTAISNSKTGPVMIMIGSIMFIPLGLLGFFGARKAIDAITRANLLEKEGNTTGSNNSKWDRL